MTSSNGNADQAERAEKFHQLHTAGPLVLPNVWDGASARLVALAGAVALATSSGAQSWAQGVADGNNLEVDEVLANIERIVAAAGGIPVSADIEGGYADSPQGVSETVAAVLSVGAVGINLEDSGAPQSSPTAPLYTVEQQADRIAAARSAATQAGVRLFINARTDVFLFGVGAESGRVDDVITRARAYEAAGADGLFVPGLLEPETLAKLAGASGLRLNAMWLPGAPSPAELAKSGVARLSTGTALAQVAYTHAQRAAGDLLDSGSYAGLMDSMDFSALNSEFAAGSGLELHP
jgi:2-methylisocitrate lyase-like PEP mutase family enzyme